LLQNFVDLPQEVPKIFTKGLSCVILTKECPEIVYIPHLICHLCKKHAESINKVHLCIYNKFIFIFYTLAIFLFAELW